MALLAAGDWDLELQEPPHELVMANLSEPRDDFVGYVKRPEFSQDLARLLQSKLVNYTRANQETVYYLRFKTDQEACNEASVYWRNMNQPQLQALSEYGKDMKRWFAYSTVPAVQAPTPLNGMRLTMNMLSVLWNSGESKRILAAFQNNLNLTPKLDKRVCCIGLPSLQRLPRDQSSYWAYYTYLVLNEIVTYIYHRVFLGEIGVQGDDRVLTVRLYNPLYTIHDKAIIRNLLQAQEPARKVATDFCNLSIFYDQPWENSTVVAIGRDFPARQMIETVTHSAGGPAVFIGHRDHSDPGVPRDRGSADVSEWLGDMPPWDFVPDDNSIGKFTAWYDLSGPPPPKLPDAMSPGAPILDQVVISSEDEYDHMSISSGDGPDHISISSGDGPDHISISS